MSNPAPPPLTDEELGELKRLIAEKCAANERLNDLSGEGDKVTPTLKDEMVAEWREALDHYYAVHANADRTIWRHLPALLAELTASREKRRGSVPSVEAIERVICGYVDAYGVDPRTITEAAQAIASLTADGGGDKLSAEEILEAATLAVHENWSSQSATFICAKIRSIPTQRPASAGGETP